MALHALRLSCFLSLSLLVVLCGCGSNKTVVCPLVGASNSSCGCGTPTSTACIAPQNLYANGLDGQIYLLSIDSGTGALGTPTSVAGASPSLGMTVLNGSFVYTSDFSMTLGAPSHVNGWAINPATGALTLVSGSPFSLGPLSVATGLASNPAAQVVYVADAGRIDALHADSNGALAPISGSPFASGTGLYLTVDPLFRFLFAAEDDPPGSIAAFTIDSAGALTPVSGSPFQAVPNSTANTQPGQIAEAMNGAFLYVNLIATGQVAGFSVDPSTGVLTPVPGSPFTAGTTPVGIVAANQHLYVSVVGGIAGYNIDSMTGALTPLSGSPFAVNAASLAADITGIHLYASSADGLMAFQIGSAGDLTQIGTTISGINASVLTTAVP